jgi:hypothetical protein
MKQLSWLMIGLVLCMMVCATASSENDFCIKDEGCVDDSSSCIQINRGLKNRSDVSVGSKLVSAHDCLAPSKQGDDDTSKKAYEDKCWEQYFCESLPAEAQSVCQSSKITMVKNGDSDTEGAYISCNGWKSTASYDAGELARDHFSSPDAVRSGPMGAVGALMVKDDSNTLARTRLQVFERCKKGVGYDAVNIKLADATPNLNKFARDSDGKVVMQDSKKPCYCPLTRCDIQTNDILFSSKSDGDLKLELGKETMGKYKAAQVGDNLCIFLNTDTGYINLGCKRRKAQIPKEVLPPPQEATDKCLKVCNDVSHYPGRAFMPISGRVVECVKDALDLFVFGGDQDSGCENSIIARLHDHMKDLVKILLVLCIIITGIKITTDGAVDKKYMLALALKIGLVIWLSLGTGTNPDGTSGNGLRYLYNESVTVMSSLSKIFLNSSTDSSTPDDALCRYENEDYLVDKRKADGSYVSNGNGGALKVDKSYLAPFDSLDCRIAYYMGIQPHKLGPETPIVLVKAILPMFFSLQILPAILLIVFAIFVLSMLIYFLNFYVVSLIILAVTFALGTIMVPLILFEETKQFFDKWLKLITSTILQVVIVSGFMAFVLLTFDKIIFGDCKFTLQEENKELSWAQILNVGIGTPDTTASKGRKYWTIANIHGDQSGSCKSVGQSESCKKSLGYSLFRYLTGEGKCGSPYPTETTLFFEYTKLSYDALANMDTLITGLLKAIVMGFFIMLFSENLAQFAAELADGIDLTKYVGKSIKETFQDLAKQAATRNPGGNAAGKGGAMGGKGGGGSGGGGAPPSGVKVGR